MGAIYRGQYIVDLQGFKSDENTFILKEIASYRAQDATIVVNLFRSPNSWNSLSKKCKAINPWLFYNFHAINWNDGEIPYEMAEDVIQSMLADSNLIAVRGEEKIMWLKQFIGDDKYVVNIEGCPLLKQFRLSDYGKCQYHENRTKKLNCARQNVILLSMWFDEYSRDAEDD